MSIHTRAAATATKLIMAYGFTVSLVRTVTGTYDPNTGSTVNSTVTESVKAVESVDYEKDIDGTNILAGDKRMLVAPTLTSAPNVDDKLIVNGVTFNVVNVNPISPGGVVIYYEVRARR